MARTPSGCASRLTIWLINEEVVCSAFTLNTLSSTGCSPVCGVAVALSPLQRYSRTVGIGIAQADFNSLLIHSFVRGREKIDALRQLMLERDIDVYLVPSDDPHLSGTYLQWL